MKDKAKTIKTLPDNKIVVTNDNKKFKAYFDLKEKVLYFFLYVKYHNFNVKGLEKDEIEAYISFLNKSRVYLNNVKEKIEAETKEKQATTNSPYEQRIIREKGEAKLDKVQAKLDKFNQKYVEAVSESNVIDEAHLIKDEPVEEEKVQSAEEPVLAPIEEAIEPTMEVQPEVVNQESVVPIEEQPIVGSDLVPIEEEKEQEIQKPVTPIEEIPVEELVKKTTEEVKEPMAISIISVRDKTEDDKTEEEKKQQAEEAKLSPLEQNFNNFEKATREIEQNFTDDLSKKISEALTLIKNEAKELVTKQLSEMSNTAKDAINTANQNTLNAKNELTAMEQDRNQYKSHYEQATEVVKQKDDIIKSRDDEINSLKAQLENKNNELKAANERENKLIEENKTKDRLAESLKRKVTSLKVAIVELGQSVEPSEKSEISDDLVQPIDLGETVEPEESPKTL